jgi:hypothetical protein
MTHTSAESGIGNSPPATAKMNTKYPGQITRDAQDIQVAAQLSARESVLKNAQKMAATAKPTPANRRMVRQSLLIESQVLPEQLYSL